MALQGKLELEVDGQFTLLYHQKLVNQDKIFLMAGHIGTAGNVASFPVQFDKNVITPGTEFM